VTFELPRTARLRKAREFDQAYAAKRRIAGRFFTMVIGPAVGTEARLGLAIAKKQAKRAHDRNLLKRMSREVFRVVRARLAPVDIVMMARTGANVASRPDLMADLQNLYARLETL
jgi:ribonuclease P protein component